MALLQGISKSRYRCAHAGDGDDDNITITIAARLSARIAGTPIPG
jgi:hypothetical protein